jgi:hypothetical protein
LSGSNLESKGAAASLKLSFRLAKRRAAILRRPALPLGLPIRAYYTACNLSLQFGALVRKCASSTVVEYASTKMALIRGHYRTQGIA